MSIDILYTYLIQIQLNLNVYIKIQALDGEKEKKNITTKWPS